MSHMNILAHTHIRMPHTGTRYPNCMYGPHTHMGAHTEYRRSIHICDKANFLKKCCWPAIYAGVDYSQQIVFMIRNKGPAAMVTAKTK